MLLLSSSFWFFVVLQEKVQGDAHDIEFQGSRVAIEDGLVRAFEGGNKGPWMEDSHGLKPCWSISESGIYFKPQICSRFKSSLRFLV